MTTTMTTTSSKHNIIEDDAHRSILVAHAFQNHRRFLYCVDVINNIINILLYTYNRDNSGLPNSTTLLLFGYLLFQPKIITLQNQVNQCDGRIISNNTNFASVSFVLIACMYLRHCRLINKSYRNIVFLLLFGHDMLK